MSELQIGIVDRMEDGRAYVRMEGSEEPLPKPMECPAGSVPETGQRVAVAKISGNYIIISSY